MTVADAVWGEVLIEEPVLQELLQSPEMERLKHINQLGLPDRLFHKPGFHRYDHSVGVLLLLRRLGASLEEQVAGLLHDVSHTAFSHVSDWIYTRDVAEGGQDENHAWYVAQSSLASILEAHNYNVDRICDHHQFDLLERDAPALCADRVDYALRESPAELREACVPFLTTHQNQIVFSDAHAARTFAVQFLHLQETCWGSFEAASRYTILGTALRFGIERGAITRQDLWRTDEDVLAQLHASGMPDIRLLLTTLEQPSLVHLPRESHTTRKKFRHVDPPVLVDGTAQPLSTIDPAFAERLHHARHENEQGHYLADVETILSTSTH